MISPEDGFVFDIHTEEIGRICLLLGGGRETKESAIDLSVGLVLHRKKGDTIHRGTPLATIHANDREKLEEAKERLLAAYEFSAARPECEPLIKAVIE